MSFSGTEFFYLSFFYTPGDRHQWLFTGVFYGVLHLVLRGHTTQGFYLVQWIFDLLVLEREEMRTGSLCPGVGTSVPVCRRTPPRYPFFPRQ